MQQKDKFYRKKRGGKYIYQSKIEEIVDCVLTPHNGFVSPLEEGESKSTPMLT